MCKSIKVALFGLGLAVVISATQAAVTTDVIGVFNGECTAFARTKVPSLPHGLWSLQDKLRVINGHKCRSKSVAVIDVGNSIGHVAVVDSCDSSGHTQGLTIIEANWKHGKITRRKAKVSGSITKAEKELRIRGYFKP